MKGFEAAKLKVQQSPELAAAIKRQIANGLLDRIGMSAAGAGAPDPGGGLESMTEPSALEAIVQRVGRPPLLIQNDRVVLKSGIDDDLHDFPPNMDALIKGTEADIPSVGRIEFVNFRLKWGGTGWVIGTSGADRIVVTNRHVASLVAKRTVDGRGVFMRDPFSLTKFGASVDFNEEVRQPAATRRHHSTWLRSSTSPTRQRPTSR